jgi:flagellar biosynthesis protein FliQ
MSSGEVVTILQRALWVTLAVGGPIVAATLVVGLLVSILQAATQVNEATLTFVPKLIVVAVILLLFGPGMLETLVGLTRELIAYTATVAR